MEEAEAEQQIQVFCVMDSIKYISAALDESIFTWSEPLEAGFLDYVDSMKFQRGLIHGRWVSDIDMVERVARDLVIRGYFSDDGGSNSSAAGDQADHLKYSTLRMDLLRTNSTAQRDQQADQESARDPPPV